MVTAAHATMAGKRLLVAEDEYFIAKGLARHLTAAGAEVVGLTASVSDALWVVQSERLDGAVLDINLRGDLVYPVADALLERGVPFVFATGYSASAIPERYAAIARCEKPVEPETFIQALFGAPS